jgi:predicted nuclease with TOPRIM domain
MLDLFQILSLVFVGINLSLCFWIYVERRDRNRSERKQLVSERTADSLLKDIEVNKGIYDEEIKRLRETIAHLKDRLREMRSDVPTDVRNDINDLLRGETKGFNDDQGAD